MNRVPFKVLLAIAIVAALMSACMPPPTVPGGGTTPVAVTQEVKATPGATVATTPAPGKPIKIGLSSSFTGPLAFIGEGYNMGVTMAIEDLGGQIEGRPLQLFTADNKCSPTDTTTAVRHLIEVEQVDAIIGSGCSSATLASLPVILEGKTPQITDSATNPTIFDQIGVGGNEWEFRINPDDYMMAKTFAPYIARENKTAVTIAENTDFGRGAISAYLEALPAAGVEVVGSEYFDLGSADFRPLLTAIKAKDPDAILIIATERDGAVLMRQLREVGLDVHIFSRGSLASPLFQDFIKDDPSIGNGILEANFGEAGMGLDPETEARFEKGGLLPTGHRMGAYYSTYYILATAIRRAIADTGDATRESIRDALEKTSLDMPWGHIEFDDHNQAYPNMQIISIQDGKVSLLDTLPTTRK